MKDDRPEMGDHINDINKALPDENFTNESKMTIYNWVAALKATFKNCAQQWREQPKARGKLEDVLHNFFVQWRVSAYLYGCMESRLIQGARGLRLDKLPDSKAMYPSELHYHKVGGVSLPIRMEYIQVELRLYNSRRNTWLDRRVCDMPLHDPKFMTSVALNHDEFYGQTEEQAAVVIAFNQLVAAVPRYQYRDKKPKLVAKPWTLMQCVSIFGSTDEIPSLLMNEPVLIIPYELINGKSDDELARIVEAALEKAEDNRRVKSDAFRYEGGEYED